ncbi:MAG: cysteine desulfurase family protein [Syntrophobacteraceae bacterium]
MQNNIIYFDNAATTPVDRRVKKEMEPYHDWIFGNPSSLHRQGRLAREAVDKARNRVAALVQAFPDEIVFTASGTEASNLALTGSVESVSCLPVHIVTSQIEHPAVLATCAALERRGVSITRLPAGPDGLIDPADLSAAMRPGTKLVSIMAANNIVGTLQPIEELGRIARSAGALFHTDAVQAGGKLPFDLRSAPVDLLSLSAHKLYGPKGVGALYVRRGTNLAPVIHGGGQEHGLRSATENVAGIVGFGCAAEIARASMAEETVKLVALQDRLIEGLCSERSPAYLIGHRYRRLPGHICLGISGMEGEMMHLLLEFDVHRIAVSSGSACSSHHIDAPSETLLAMGFDPVRARGSLRITLGRFNTADEVEYFLELFPKIIQKLRPISSRQSVKAG